MPIWTAKFERAFHDRQCSLSTVIAAFEECGNFGSKVINFSAGASLFAQSLEDVIDRLYAQGVLIVAPSGNAGNTSMYYPASYESVISVSAVDEFGAIPWFSNFNTQVELAAPGALIPSTVPNNRYAMMNGTSMATPHVTGVAALVWSHFPECSNVEIRQVLQQSALKQKKYGNRLRRDAFYGYGVVDALAAYNMLAAKGGCGGPF